MPEQSNDHYYNTDKEYEQGYPVHTMHQEYVGILRCIFITLTYVEIR